MSKVVLTYEIDRPSDTENGEREGDVLKRAAYVDAGVEWLRGLDKLRDDFSDHLNSQGYAHACTARLSRGPRPEGAPKRGRRAHAEIADAAE